MTRHVFEGQTDRPAMGSGFTLVELLIVIVIIGILAAAAVPHFGESSADAKLAALNQTLTGVRSAIELYHHQHDKAFPGQVRSHRGGASDAQAAHADANTAFALQLTMYSNANGDTCAEKSSSFPYGPYLRNEIPANPLPAATAEAAANVVNVTTDTTPLAVDNTPATGWKASSETGQFIANNGDHASR